MTDDDMALVDQIDEHQCMAGVDGPPFCRRCHQSWPCWTVRVAQHSYVLGQCQGHVDAAFYVAPDDSAQRMVITVMTPYRELPPYPSLDPAEAMADPTQAFEVNER